MTDAIVCPGRIGVLSGPDRYGRTGPGPASALPPRRRATPALRLMSRPLPLASWMYLPFESGPTCSVYVPLRVCVVKPTRNERVEVPTVSGVTVTGFSDQLFSMPAWPVA